MTASGQRLWEPSLKKPYYRDLYNFVRDEYATHVVYPPDNDIFNAIAFTPLNKVKVLILGEIRTTSQSGAWIVVFSASVSEGYSTITAEYLQGA